MNSGYKVDLNCIFRKNEEQNLLLISKLLINDNNTKTEKFETSGWEV